jgi:lysophospholipase L1-like esterase
VGLSLRRIAGIAAICLTAGCTPASAPALTQPSGSAKPLGFRTGWGPEPPLLRIMALGDSITYGVGSTDGSGYRARLDNRLVAVGFRVDFVGSRDSGPPGADDDNEGHSGWTISRMARRVDRWLIAYRPDVVLLHIGTNDVRTDRYRAGAAKRLGVLLNRIRRDRPAAYIFVAQIAGSRQPALQRRIDAYNAGVARMLAIRDDPLLHLVNQAAVRAPWLHPNDAGYAAMADNWFTALTAVRPDIRLHRGRVAAVNRQWTGSGSRAVPGGPDPGGVGRPAPPGCASARPSCPTPGPGTATIR